MSTPKLIPVILHWKTFCTNHPELGLLGNKNSWIWMNRNHGAALIAAGAMVRTLGRKLLVDPDKFDQVAFDILIGKAVQS